MLKSPAISIENLKIEINNFSWFRSQLIYTIIAGAFANNFIKNSILLFYVFYTLSTYFVYIGYFFNFVVTGLSLNKI